MIQHGYVRHLGQMLRSEPEEMTVRRLAQRPRGGSGNNPFLEEKRSVMEYKVLIEPQIIAKKLMQVRYFECTDYCVCTIQNPDK